jgi:ferritin-like protein
LIDTRQEIIYALNEAAEIEHGFMIQYIFAALSMKKYINEGITGEQQELIRKWESEILSVAREEMAHLGTVCNLLSAVGGAPHFERPNFPQKATQYYPFDFILSRFSDESLYRFIRFELPKGELLPLPPKQLTQSKLFALFPFAPDPIEYDYLGELYNKIRYGFNILPEDELFIGPKGSQDSEYWSRRMEILRVTDRKSANNAIAFIIEGGEGSPGNREGSHYETFLTMRNELNLQSEEETDFDPSRPVVLNPRTRKIHRDAPIPGTFIEKDSSKKVAELFNMYYELSLLILSQLYSFGGESLGERDVLRQSSRQLMTMGIRPIAEILTAMPATNEPSDGNAGPPFELYGDLQLSTQETNRWLILNERFETIIAETIDLSDINKRLSFIAENISIIQNNIKQILLSEEKL